MRLHICLIVLSMLFLTACSSDQSARTWSFASDGRILSHPITADGVVYFGNSSGTFYAVNARDGSQKWSYATDYPIRGTAHIADNTVFVVSGNNVHALHTETGEQLWAYRSPDPDGAEQIDPWDYHTGSLATHGTIVYAGSGDGYVRGFDIASGEVEELIPSTDAVPVRSGLLIEDDILYFGDWDGRVYAYDLESGKTVWEKRTYDERPYDTFGSLTAEFTINGDLLYFGGRNPTLHVLNKHTGELVWSYVEEEGGWISGDPLVEKGVLYIGGSDNHELFAFDASTGKKLWTFEFTFNNFSRPLVRDDILFLTTGDSYTVWGNAIGRGFLYAINAQDGSLRNVHILEGNSFTSPVIADDLLFVGSEDSSLHAFDVARLMYDDFEPSSIGYDAVRIGAVVPQPLVTESNIGYSVLYPGQISLEITTLGDSTIRQLYLGDQPAGDHSIMWDGKDDNGRSVDDGYYFVNASSKEFYRTAFVHKKTSE